MKVVKFSSYLFLVIPLAWVNTLLGVNAYMQATISNGTTLVNPSGKNTTELDLTVDRLFGNLKTREGYGSGQGGSDCGNRATLTISGAACSEQKSLNSGNRGCNSAEVRYNNFSISASAVGSCLITYATSETGAGTNSRQYQEQFDIKLFPDWQAPPTDTKEGDSYVISYSEKNRIGTVAFGATYKSQTPVICRIESNGNVINLAGGECIVEITTEITNAYPQAKVLTKRWNILADQDRDTIPDIVDNCIATPNQDQANFDKALEDLAGEENIGDACNEAIDKDGDNIQDSFDLCPLLDIEQDPAALEGAKNHPDDTAPFGVGDSCQQDSDGDGLLDFEDNCPFDPNPQQDDTDNDGLGDACEANSDEDSFDDNEDNCPFTTNEDQLDTDNDGIGEACEPDSDGDGVKDDVLGQKDNCPFVPNPDQLNTDGDQFGDACEITYVKLEANGGDDRNDCSSWDAACETIQKAIDEAVSRNQSKVFIQQGVYAPNDPIILATGIQLIGGFLGGEVAENEAKPAINRTIITGDLSYGTANGDTLTEGITAAGADHQGTVNSATLIQAINLNTASSDKVKIKGLIFNAASSSAFAIENSFVDLINAQFIANIGDEDGTALKVKNSSLKLVNVDFIKNEAVVTHSIGFFDDSQVDIIRSTINQNQLAHVLVVAGQSVLTLDQVTLSNNNIGVGGVLSVESATAIVTIKNSRFIDNQSTNGGGIAVSAADSLSITNTVFDNNRASAGPGGAILLNDASQNLQASIKQSTFMNNSASKNGGAIALGNGQSLLIENVTFANNAAGVDETGAPSGSNGLGGAINLGGTPISTDIYHSTFVGNQAVTGGGAISINNNAPGILSLKANLITGNGSSTAANVYLRDTGGANEIIDLGYNYIGLNNTAGTLPTDLFDFTDTSSLLSIASINAVVASTPTVSAGDGYGSPLPMLPLIAQSPARDVIPAEDCSVATDQRGETRPDTNSGRCDVGAYEFTVLSCVDDAQRRQANGEQLIKICDPRFENFEFTIGSVHYLWLLVCFAVMVIRQRKIG